MESGQKTDGDSFWNEDMIWEEQEQNEIGGGEGKIAVECLVQLE